MRKRKGLDETVLRIIIGFAFILFGALIFLSLLMGAQDKIS